MLRTFKNLWGAACLAAAVQSASAFSFWGPREPYHVGQLGYIFPFDAPHNLGEEFRWNVPRLYYTFDQTFWDYFSTNGVQAIDGAMQILNATLSTNVSSWSAELEEFPLEASQLNYTASALHLFDLKSCALELMVKELCLADPEAFTWTLRNRALPPGLSCPYYWYGVIKRNFDPVTFLPSVYVNGVLYTYWIEEFCPAADQAITVPVPVDMFSFASTPIASPKIFVATESWFGYYHLGLTRDDAGGLRYLLRTNNINIENAGSGTLTYVTNDTSQLLYTSNLATFAELALTNSDAALTALYPDLVFSATATNYPVVVTNAVAVPYYTNYPYEPYGTVPHLVYTTNYTLSVELRYRHYYANLEVVEFRNGAWTNFLLGDTSSYTNREFATLQTISVAPSNTPYAPYGMLAMTTNITTHNFLTNEVGGEFFLLPTNACDMLILANLLTQTNAYTNLLSSATNVLTLTNIVQNTNVTGGTNIELFTENLITYSTNHVFLVLPILCQATNLAARQGIDTMQFVRRDYDSLLNRFWYPITNTFRAYVVTNNTTYRQTITRVVTAPDIVFSAADLVSPPTTWPIVNFATALTVPNWDTNGIATTAGVLTYGPGTVALPGTGLTALSFTFNKVGPFYYNYGPFQIDEATATLDFVWGSFDGTTNFPIIYPVGTSITNFENQVVLQAFPGALPAGLVANPYVFIYTNAASGVVYTNTFSGAGGQAPYSFALAPGSVLPPGFDQPAPPDFILPNGLLSGTPAARGTNGFTIRMSDAGQRFIDTPYSVTINP